MAEVTYPDGTVKPVKNLGWILKHKREVIAVYVYSAGMFKAILADGRVYQTNFADRSILRQFVLKHWPDITVFSHKMYENEREHSDKHYIAMVSSGGLTLADSCSVHRTYNDAVDYLSSAFDLDNDDMAELQDIGKFVHHDFDYAHLLEIVECTCDNPFIHQDEYASESEFNNEFYPIIPDELPIMPNILFAWNLEYFNHAVKGFVVRKFTSKWPKIDYEHKVFSRNDIVSAVLYALENRDQFVITDLDFHTSESYIEVHPLEKLGCGQSRSTQVARYANNKAYYFNNLLSLAYFMGIFNPTKES